MLARLAFGLIAIVMLAVALLSFLDSNPIWRSVTLVGGALTFIALALIPGPSGAQPRAAPVTNRGDSFGWEIWLGVVGVGLLLVGLGLRIFA
ncbi:MAG: hypothetical protein JNM76_09915 [Betaproteobacteria bacterium]|nr:hypothetical protein [Betaproteobacteria bacterium]